MAAPSLVASRVNRLVLRLSSSERFAEHHLAQVVSGQHVILIGTGYRGHVAPRAGGDDHRIGLERGEQGGAGLCAKPHLRARTFHFADQPLEQPFVGFIGERGKPQRPAEPLAALDQCDLVALLGEPPGRLHAAGTAADHYNMARRWRPGQGAGNSNSRPHSGRTAQRVSTPM